MKKFISVVLSVIMLFGIMSVAGYAASIPTYEVIFTEQEFPFSNAKKEYSLFNYRLDYVGKYMGYDYGVDYWYTLVNGDGTTTDIKGLPYSVSVYEGDPIEFKVSVADYIEPSSVRMLAFPTATAEADPTVLYDDVTGEPHSTYHLTTNAAKVFGLRPTEDMTVCLSEYHLYNDAFLCNLPHSSYYTTRRVQYTGDGESYRNPDWYSDFEWGNKKVVYVNETLFFEVRIPLDDNEHTYHLDTYQVYYTTGSGHNTVTTYIKTADQVDWTQNENCVAHYEVEADEEAGIRPEWVDIYKIENVDPSISIKVAGTVTYTMSMLREFFQDFDLKNMDDFDWDSVDFAPMVEYISRILVLIMKILAGFGLSISL